MKTLPLLSLLLLGCEEPPTDPPTAFQRDLAGPLLTCTVCHSGEQPKGGLDLTNPFASVEAPSSQLDMVLIAPGDHLQSYLWHKVAGTHSIAQGLGQRMPVNASWSQETIDLLGQWIDLGCPE